MRTGVNIGIGTIDLNKGIREISIAPDPITPEWNTPANYSATASASTIAAQVRRDNPLLGSPVISLSGHNLLLLLAAIAVIVFFLRGMR
jgi:hypothetical protein